MNTKSLPSDFYVGLIASASPPVVKVTIKGLAGFCPSVEDWRLEFEDKQVERLFGQIAAAGFPVDLRFFGKPGELITGVKVRTRQVWVSRILNDR